MLEGIKAYIAGAACASLKANSKRTFLSRPDTHTQRLLYIMLVLGKWKNKSVARMFSDMPVDIHLLASLGTRQSQIMEPSFLLSCMENISRNPCVWYHPHFARCNYIHSAPARGSSQALIRRIYVSITRKTMPLVNGEHRRAAAIYIEHSSYYNHNHNGKRVCMCGDGLRVRARASM